MFGRLEGADALLDFAAEDVIAFRAESFGLAPGAFSASMLQYGSSATGTDGVFLFDAATRTLRWDPDGAGAQAAETIAVFGTAVTPAVEDFILI